MLLISSDLWSLGVSLFSIRTQKKIEKVEERIFEQKNRMFFEHDKELWKLHPSFNRLEPKYLCTINSNNYFVIKLLFIAFKGNSLYIPVSFVMSYMSDKYAGKAIQKSI